MLKHEIHLVNGLSQKYVEKLSSYHTLNTTYLKI